MILGLKCMSYWISTNQKWTSHYFNHMNSWCFLMFSLKLINVFPCFLIADGIFSWCNAWKSEIRNWLSDTSSIARGPGAGICGGFEWPCPVLVTWPVGGHSCGQHWTSNGLAKLLYGQASPYVTVICWHIIHRPKTL